MDFYLFIYLFILNLKNEMPTILGINLFFKNAHPSWRNNFFFVQYTLQLLYKNLPCAFRVYPMFSSKAKVCSKPPSSIGKSIFSDINLMKPFIEMFFFLVGEVFYFQILIAFQ